MRKVTGALIVAAFLLFAFSAQAATGLDVSIPSAGDPCSNDLDCGPGEVCIDDICSVATPCTNDLGCGPGELCIDDICSVATPCTNDLGCELGESCLDGICVPGGPECLSDEDCSEGQYCKIDRWKEEPNQCAELLECDLRIRPPKVKILNKKGLPRNLYLVDPILFKKIKITGNENFNPREIAETEDWDTDPILPGASSPGLTYKAKNRSLSMRIQVSTLLEPGMYPMRFGPCTGEIELK